MAINVSSAAKAASKEAGFLAKTLEKLWKKPITKVALATTAVIGGVEAVNYGRKLHDEKHDLQNAVQQQALQMEQQQLAMQQSHISSLTGSEPEVHTGKFTTQVRQQRGQVAPEAGVNQPGFTL